MPQSTRDFLQAQIDRATLTDSQQADIHRDLARTFAENSCDKSLPPEDRKQFAAAAMLEADKSDESAKWVRLVVVGTGAGIGGVAAYAIIRKVDWGKLVSKTKKLLT